MPSNACSSTSVGSNVPAMIWARVLRKSPNLLITSRSADSPYRRWRSPSGPVSNASRAGASASSALATTWRYNLTSLSRLSSWSMIPMSQDRAWFSSRGASFASGSSASRRANGSHCFAAKAAIPRLFSRSKVTSNLMSPSFQSNASRSGPALGAESNVSPHRNTRTTSRLSTISIACLPISRTM